MRAHGARRSAWASGPAGLRARPLRPLLLAACCTLLTAVLVAEPLDLPDALTTWASPGMRPHPRRDILVLYVLSGAGEDPQYCANFDFFLKWV